MAVDLSASATCMLSAASPDKPAARQLFAPVELSPNARQRAHVLSVTIRPRVRVVDAYWHMRRSAARADLDDQPTGHDAYEYPQILSRTAIKIPIRSATTKRMPSGVVLCHSDRVSGWHQHSAMAQTGRLQSRQSRHSRKWTLLSGSQTRHASPVCESVPHWSRTFYRVPSMFQKLLEQTLLEPSH